MKVFVIWRSNDELYEDKSTEVYSVEASELKAKCLALFLTLISRTKKYLSNLFAVKEYLEPEDWSFEDKKSIFYVSDDSTWSYGVEEFELRI